MKKKVPAEPMLIELWPIDRPKPYAKNARTVSARAIDAVATSLKEFGWRQPIVCDAKDVIIAGHKRLLAAQKLGLPEVPVHVAKGLTAAQARAYRLMDNRSNQNSEWDLDLLQAEMIELQHDIDLALTGFEAAEIAKFLAASVVADPEATPPAPADPVSKLGDLWLLDGHRVLCGDSTSSEDVTRLANGVQAPLLHADPPYGMGKENEGVENDNLNAANLASFQMRWWKAFRPFLTDNASVYIWGNAPGLWRLWYSGGLEASERMTFRNEVVWDKGAGRGQNSDELRSYAAMTERCLFFMLGEQGFGNVNKEDYWEGFEPIRSHLVEQAEKMKWGAQDIKRLTGVGMFGHWFSKSQWVMIPEVHYKKLQEAAAGNAFVRAYADLGSLYAESMKDDEHLLAKHKFYGMRAFFDNVHDNMNEVWNFAPVLGEERHGHATPKPVEMIARAIKSSAPLKQVVLEPFGGSGSTLIACEKNDRLCYTMELAPEYVDVIVTRWEAFTGKKATLECGAKKPRTFGQVKAARAAA